MNVLKAISLKVMSASLFAVLSALVRFLGEKYPVGQIVFFRSAFAVLLMVLIYASRSELAAALRTVRPLGHIGRGFISIFAMFCNFAALAPAADRRGDRHFVCRAADHRRSGCTHAQGARAHLSMVRCRRRLHWHSGDVGTLFRACFACRRSREHIGFDVCDQRGGV
jgi:hypothetical protein